MKALKMSRDANHPIDPELAAVFKNAKVELEVVSIGETVQKELENRGEIVVGSVETEEELEAWERDLSLNMRSL